MVTRSRVEISISYHMGHHKCPNVCTLPFFLPLHYTFKISCRHRLLQLKNRTGAAFPTQNHRMIKESYFPVSWNICDNPSSYSCCCSVTQSCPTLCNPMDCSMQASLSFTNSRDFLKLMSIGSVIASNHLILCRPLLLLPSIFPSIGVFSNESVLHIR